MLRLDNRAEINMYNRNFFVLTGGPGAGKTTTISLLQKDGFRIFEESGRKIIRQQICSAGEALPWKNREKYAQMMALDSIESYKTAMKIHGIVLFDRGIPDTLGYCHLENIPYYSELDKACFECRYNETVFLFPFWEEIYSTDTERKQDKKTAEATTDMMERTYAELGYRVIKVPFLSPMERAAWIKKKIKEILL